MNSFVYDLRDYPIHWVCQYFWAKGYAWLTFDGPNVHINIPLLREHAKKVKQLLCKAHGFFIWNLKQGEEISITKGKTFVCALNNQNTAELNIAVGYQELIMSVQSSHTKLLFEFFSEAIDTESSFENFMKMFCKSYKEIYNL